MWPPWCGRSCWQLTILFLGSFEYKAQRESGKGKHWKADENGQKKVARPSAAFTLDSWLYDIVGPSEVTRSSRDSRPNGDANVARSSDPPPTKRGAPAAQAVSESPFLRTLIGSNYSHGVGEPAPFLFGADTEPSGPSKGKGSTTQPGTGWYRIQLNIGGETCIQYNPAHQGHPDCVSFSVPHGRRS